MWIPRGQFAEGKAWAARALDVFSGSEPSRELALMLEAAGWLHVLGGEYPSALPFFERAHGLFAALPAGHDRARSKITLGVTCVVLGDERGGPLSDEALALSAELGEPYLMGLARVCDGVRHHVSGDIAQASMAYEKALHAFSDYDHVYWRGQMLQNLAIFRLQEGKWEQARDLAGQALAVGREYNYPMIRNQALSIMGAVHALRGSPIQAAKFLGAVEASLGELGVGFEPPEEEAMQETIRALQSVLSPSDYAAALEEGRHWGAVDIDEAVSSLQYNPPS
jgi:tetratricopeptide (TPR) repeat protein